MSTKERISFTLHDPMIRKMRLFKLKQLKKREKHKGH